MYVYECAYILKNLVTGNVGEVDYLSDHFGVEIFGLQKGLTEDEVAHIVELWHPHHLYVCMCVCMYVSMYVCMYNMNVCICMYVCTVCVYAMYVCMYE